METVSFTFELHPKIMRISGMIGGGIEATLGVLGV